MILVDRVAELYRDARADRCDEHCRLAMRGSPRRAILKGEDLAGAQGIKMRGCLVFRNDLKVVAAELKRHTLDPDSIHEKPLNGGREAARIAGECASAGKIDLVFIVLAKSYGNRSARGNIAWSNIDPKQEVSCKSRRVRL